tara:strand:+ start:7774 stop:8124 length:351 start_codon:yes stop_codon:yes gene_type:complete
MTQDRNNFSWRPNDNSITTKTRYDLEMGHWMNSFKSGTSSKGTSNYKGDVGVIGLFITLIFSFLILILSLVIDFFKLFKRNPITTIEKDRVNKRDRYNRMMESWDKNEFNFSEPNI